ncbi:MAG: phosphoribosylformylglycinamidine cyclo-ligase [Brevinematales bacterium]|nr:phosphoribosylformylglycinamidine cyclo-ligase [Brevinematales bacterium]
MDYKKAGVDIEKADSLVKDISRMAKETYIDGVIEGIGGFGALFELKKYKNPVIVSSTDGVGTKILIAEEMKKFSGLGFDLVAMCVDDIVCQGAKPLFFLDYIAIGKLKEDMYLKIIEGISKACKFAGCALIGGETAEQPDVYPEDGFDLAGFSIGVVEKKDIIKKIEVKKNDVVIGLASSGFHSNGYSLIRKIVKEKGLSYKENYGFGILGDILLTPTEIYSPIIIKALKNYRKHIHGIAHITGGGIEGNLSRVLPNNLKAIVFKNSWKKKAEMDFIIEKGEVEEKEAYKVFNMGIGMTLIVAKEKQEEIMKFFNENSYKAYLIGEITEGNGEVELR